MKVLTTKQVAEELQVCPDTVREWIRCGSLKAFNAGTGENVRWRIPPASVEEFIQQGGNNVKEHKITY